MRISVALKLFVIALLLSSKAWAMMQAPSCLEMVKPVDSNDYTGTSEDFKKGFSTLFRDRYTNTTHTYYEGIGSHPGVDITHDKAGNHFSKNTPVRAICEGFVKRVTQDGKKDGGWGNSLTIRHEVPGLGTIFSVYAHLDKFAREFKKDDPVFFGEQIGFVGTTGKSTGIHLHFQIDNTTPNKHPFFPNRSVNTPDSDRLVADRTFSPLTLVQQHILPQQTFITIDGDPSDWRGINPILTDPQGDAPFDSSGQYYPGMDILNISVTNDDINAYFLIEFAGDPFVGAAILFLDTDINTDTGCVPFVGSEYVAVFHPPGELHPSFWLGDWRDCGADSNDFPGAIQFAILGRFVEASISIENLRILTPNTNGFRIWGETLTPGPTNVVEFVFPATTYMLK